MEVRCPIVLDRAGQDIHAEGARLRTQGPLARVELPDGILGWSVTSYELLKEVLTDPRFSKDARKYWPAYIDGEVPPNWQMINWVEMDNMTTRDGEDHRRLRRLISKAFTPRSLESARPLIEKITDALLDDLAKVPGGEVVDIKGRFTYPLPATVICELFGVPESARERVLYGGQVNASTDITGDEAVASIEHYHAAILDLVAMKHEEPGDDLTSLLISAQEEDGSGLTDTELISTLHLMLGAGSETVMNLLSHATLALLTHPDQRELVMSGQVGWDAVFEETMRVESPTANLPFRFATEDVQFGDVTIPRGEPILLGFASAGRDPDVHGETAAVFDLTRTNKAHLSFGQGAHFCLGAPLARLEASIALPRLFNRFPDMRVAAQRNELEPQGTFIMNGHRRVLVHLMADD
jgi:2-hydroxy-5-methyl-1-naphthoate 7-hydroxylase